MIDSNELIFVVDERNNPLQPQLRSFVHANGLWHRTTGIWVINEKKEVLCQKRSLKKDIKPGFWEAFFGGHMGPNTEYLATAVRECSEELGILVKKEDLIPYKLIKSEKPTHKEFQFIYGLICNKDISEFNFEKEEIDQLKWVALGDLRNILLDKISKGWVQKPWDNEVLTWLELHL